MTQKDSEIKNKTHRIIDRNSVASSPSFISRENEIESEEDVLVNRRGMLKAILPALGKVITSAAREVSTKVHEVLVDRK